MGKIIYFDNAATSFPKPKSVIKDVVECCKYYCGNPGRSGHILSLKAAEAVYAAREKVSKLLGIDTPERVIFTQNATHSLNIAIKGLIRAKCHVLISNLEHNSVIRPLASLQKMYGVEYSLFDHASPESLIYLKRDNTKFIITTTRSNVIGIDLDYVRISNFCRENSIGLILDVSQFIGHKEFRLTDLYYDAVCAPGHKGLMGIQGAGILILGKNTNPECLTEGGSGNNTFNINMPTEPPEKYEAGTLATPAIVSLAGGISYIEKVGIDYINEKISSLTVKLNERLNDLSDVHILGCNNGICAFNLGVLPSSQVAELLDNTGICVRGGYHCSPLTHQLFKTEKQGAVRVSLSHFNKEYEIDALYRRLKNISRTYIEN